MLDPKTPRETYPVEFDFSKLLASVTTATVTVTLLSGADASPSAILSGPTQISGAKVFQELTGGVDGAKYGLLCRASDETKTFELADAIEVVEAFPNV